MRKTLEVIAGAVIAASCGLAAAQMTPAMPASPSNTSPSTKTDTTVPSGSASTSTSTSVSGAGQFAKLDSDADGTVSKKEAAMNKSLTAKWDTLDSNKDGKLDQGEFAQFEASGGASTAPKY